jgi:hypothetical protein
MADEKIVRIERIAPTSARHWQQPGKPALFNIPHADILACVGALTVLVILMLVCRGAALSSTLVFNNDEAELLASGRRAAGNLFPYASYTTPTFLFLWPLVLGALAEIGLPMSLPAAHLLSGLAYVAIMFVFWRVLAQRLGWRISALFVFPTAMVLFAGPRNGMSDFLALGTELLPVVILMAGAWVLLRTDARPGWARLAVIAALAGTAVWAKPQLIFLAMALCLVGFLLRRLSSQTFDPARDAPGNPESSGAWRDAALIGVAFAAPSVLFVGLMLIGNTFGAFLAEPVAFTLGYTFGRDQAVRGESVSIITRLAGLWALVGAHPLAYVPMIPGIVAIAAIWRSAKAHNRVIAVAIVLTPLVAALLTLVVLYPLFAHYANILYAAGLLSGMAGLVAAIRIRLTGDTFPLDEPTHAYSSIRMPHKVVVGMRVFAVLLVVSYTLTIASNIHDLAAHLLAPAAAAPVASSTTATACPASSRVFVWGWAPELYAEFNWTPASRYISSMLLLPWGLQNNYRTTLENEVVTDPPRCIVDATGPAFFGGFGPSDALPLSVPGLEPFLAACYRASPDVLPGSRAVTLWILREEAGCTNRPASNAGSMSNRQVLVAAPNERARRIAPA